MADRSITELRLLAAAATLLENGGPDAVTTRAVLEAASVTAPTLYHHFADKDGLLDALLYDGVVTFFEHRSSFPETADALADLVSSWEEYLTFLVEQPQLSRLLVLRAMNFTALLDVATTWCRGRFEQLETDRRLLVDVSLALRTLLVVASGVSMFGAPGIPAADLREVGRFVFEGALATIVRAYNPWTDRNPLRGSMVPLSRR